MQQLTLDKHFSLLFEPLGKRLKLIIGKADEEIACRKETIKNLENFLQSDESTIFKGRVQFHKINEEIEIILKTKPIAKILAADFKQVLNNLQ